MKKFGAKIESHKEFLKKQDSQSSYENVPLKLYTDEAVLYTDNGDEAV